MSKLLGTIILCACATACGRGEPRPATETPTPATAENAMPRVDAPDGNFSGEVEERLDAGSYTYMSIRTPSGGEWVVTLGGGAPVGSSVDVTNMGVRTEFHSKRLDKTFSRLVFGIVRNRS